MVTRPTEARAAPVVLPAITRRNSSQVVTAQHRLNRAARRLRGRKRGVRPGWSLGRAGRTRTDPAVWQIPGLRSPALRPLTVPLEQAPAVPGRRIPPRRPDAPSASARPRAPGARRTPAPPARRSPGCRTGARPPRQTAGPARRWLIGSLQRRHEQGVGPCRADAEEIAHRPHHRPPRRLDTLPTTSREHDIFGSPGAMQAARGLLVNKTTWARRSHRPPLRHSEVSNRLVQLPGVRRRGGKRVHSPAATG